jgi:hypothetical protein
MKIHSTNPFLEPIRVPILDQKSNYTLASGSGGQITLSRQFDIKASTKVYKDDSLFTSLMNLKSSTMKVYQFIVYKLTRDSDVIQLKREIVAQLTGLHKNTVTLSLDELENNKIIARKSKFTYWVNIDYIFNGDRVSFMKDNDRENQIITLVRSSK